MRTVILLAGFAIADAIRIDWYPKNPDAQQIIGIIGICVIVMDLVEFFNNLKKK